MKALRVLLTEGLDSRHPPTMKGQPAELPAKPHGINSTLINTKEDLSDVQSVTSVATSAATNVSSFSKITASPLDYHSFRQELLHKYPAYNAPSVPSFVTKSLIPNGFTDLSFSTSLTSASTTPSILHQPVHIATPAPSPPPSPIAGKGGKKHNYQTNQNFPFLYPPTASGGWKDGWANMNSNDVGVPASIREGGDLFRSRIRVSPALQQLADEKERYQKSERGWTGAEEELKRDEEKIRNAGDRCKDFQTEVIILERVDTLYVCM